MIDKIEFYEMELKIYNMVDDDIFRSKHHKYMNNIYENHIEEYNELIKDMPTHIYEVVELNEMILWLKNKIIYLKRDEKINKLLNG